MNRRGFLQSLIAVPLAAVAMPAVPVPAFTGGGYFMNFGAGTRTMLHGKETVLSAVHVGDIRIKLQANTQEFVDAMRKAAASMQQLKDSA